MSIVTEPLNAFSLPISGTRLIEASAGTGKTYTIANLYLRLLLGIGEPRPLTVDEILVVTFTNAATSELRDRIRRRILTAFKVVLGEESQDAFLRELLAAINDKAVALRQLDLALKTLDEAAIYTIHGFCQRILSDMAFESALLFESEFTLDDSEYLSLAAADFWRSQCYPLTGEMAAIIHSKYPSPMALVGELRSLLGARMAVPMPRPEAFERLSQNYLQELNRLRLSWPRENEAVLETLMGLPLNGTSYGKAADGFPKLDAQWQAMSAWAMRGEGLPPLKALEMLSYSNIKLNKGGVMPLEAEVALLGQIERLLASHQGLIPAFLLQARDDIRSRFGALKAKHNLLAPDDLLLTLARALGYDHADAAPGANHNQANHDKASHNQVSHNQASHNNGGSQPPAAEDAAIQPTAETACAQQPGALLASAVAARYPLALIDEFQDTDPLQFAIFNAIYQPGGNARGLLMIGDPKQAIYAFRGGDIHTYLDARRSASAHYSLGTNYRSSKAMVSAVNRLFQARERVFLTEDIPFDAVAAADNGSKALLIDGEPASAMEIALLVEQADGGLNKHSARKAMAADTAAHIDKLLQLAGENRAWLSDKNRALRAKDIAVLVRDRNEAAFVKEELSKRQIGAVFLSRDSVLGTAEAREMMHLLYALAYPRDEKRLRAAMATRLMGYCLSDLVSMDRDEERRALELERFEAWHQRWQRQGVMPALMAFADDTRLLQRLGAEPEAERRLTDFRHLCELLEQAASKLDGISALIGWYEQTLTTPAADEAQQLRLESEQNLVQIVTIHKSKGLEYGLCYIPFLSLARDSRGKPSPMVYHSGEALVWDLLQTDEGADKYDAERLAEDLRLLYVALTRPIYGCRLGLANHSKMLKAGISSEVYKTALGYLLGIDSKDCDGERLRAKAAALISGTADITLVDVELAADTNAADSKATLVNRDETNDIKLAPRVPSRRFEVPWRIGSYSALIATAHGYGINGINSSEADSNYFHNSEPTSGEKSNNKPNKQALNSIDIIHSLAETATPASLPGGADESYGVEETPWALMPSLGTAQSLTMDDDTEDLLSRATFPRGANAGSFMHLVLERLAFNEVAESLPLVLPDAMSEFGIDPKWQPLLTSWYQEVMAAPLNDGQACFSLNQLPTAKLLVEMEFYLPVSQLRPRALGNLLSLYHYRADFGFDTLNGMLKGFIDLTFSHNGRYYIADYKSNHLGDALNDYHQDAMKQAIGEHHYDLQYLLYTLALHRLLRNRLADYDYDRHIGGCFYLFLRGMAPSSPGSGVFFDRPPRLLIEALDALFEGNEVRI